MSSQGLAEYAALAGDADVVDLLAGEPAYRHDEIVQAIFVYRPANGIAGVIDALRRTGRADLQQCAQRILEGCLVRGDAFELEAALRSKGLRREARRVKQVNRSFGRHQVVSAEIDRPRSPPLYPRSKRNW